MRYATHRARIAWARVEYESDLFEGPPGIFTDENGNRYDKRPGRPLNTRWPVIVGGTLRPIERKLEVVK